MHLTHEQDDLIAYAIVPDKEQDAQSTCLDWEPLFINNFAMFRRTTIHTDVFKGTCFTALESALGTDPEAVLDAIEDFWNEHGFAVMMDAQVSK